jgi:hypothetical protein
MQNMSFAIGTKSLMLSNELCVSQVHPHPSLRRSPGEGSLLHKVIIQSQTCLTLAHVDGNMVT